MLPNEADAKVTLNCSKKLIFFQTWYFLTFRKRVQGVFILFLSKVCYFFSGIRLKNELNGICLRLCFSSLRNTRLPLLYLSQQRGCLVLTGKCSRFVSMPGHGWLPRYQIMTEQQLATLSMPWLPNSSELESLCAA